MGIRRPRRSASRLPNSAADISCWLRNSRRLNMYRFTGPLGTICCGVSECPGIRYVSQVALDITSRNERLSHLRAAPIFASMHRRPRSLPDRPVFNRIAEWRVARGLSQPALAAKMGTSKQTVHRHENTKDATLDWLERYARALDVRIEELLPNSQRVPTTLTEVVREAEKLPQDRLPELLDHTKAMVRHSGSHHRAAGFAEADPAFNHTKLAGDQ